MLSNIGRLFVRSSTISRSYQLTTRSLQTSVQNLQDRRVADGLSYDELQKRIHSNDIYLVDVRRSDEVAEGRIPGIVRSVSRSIVAPRNLKHSFFCNTYTYTNTLILGPCS